MISRIVFVEKSTFFGDADNIKQYRTPFECSLDEEKTDYSLDYFKTSPRAFSFKLFSDEWLEENFLYVYEREYSAYIVQAYEYDVGGGDTLVFTGIAKISQTVRDFENNIIAISCFDFLELLHNYTNSKTIDFTDETKAIEFNLGTIRSLSQFRTLTKYLLLSALTTYFEEDELSDDYITNLKDAIDAYTIPDYAKKGYARYYSYKSQYLTPGKAVTESYAECGNYYLLTGTPAPSPAPIDLNDVNGDLVPNNIIYDINLGPETYNIVSGGTGYVPAVIHYVKYNYCQFDDDIEYNVEWLTGLFSYFERGFRKDAYGMPVYIERWYSAFNTLIAYESDGGTEYRGGIGYNWSFTLWRLTNGNAFVLKDKDSGEYYVSSLGQEPDLERLALYSPNTLFNEKMRISDYARGSLNYKANIALPNGRATVTGWEDNTVTPSNYYGFGYDSEEGLDAFHVYAGLSQTGLLYKKQELSALDLWKTALLCQNIKIHILQLDKISFSFVTPDSKANETVEEISSSDVIGLEATSYKADKIDFSSLLAVCEESEYSWLSAALNEYYFASVFRKITETTTCKISTIYNNYQYLVLDGWIEINNTPYKIRSIRKESDNIYSVGLYGHTGTNYLLLEDSARFKLEDGTGAFIMEV